MSDEHLASEWGDRLMERIAWLIDPECPASALPLAHRITQDLHLDTYRITASIDGSRRRYDISGYYREADK